MSPPNHCNCRCVLVRMESAAERLLRLARRFGPSDQLVVAGDPLSGAELALAALALRLAWAPADLRLRALVEEWDQPRIIWELY